MSADTTYQALQGPTLAALRMAAVPEALAAELDHAREEDPGHVEVLERLFATEVTASHERRRSWLERIAKLPAPWRLADFDFEAQPAGTESS